MPIEALGTLAGPLSGVLQSRSHVAPGEMPDAAVQALKGAEKSSDQAGTVTTGPTFGQMLQNAIGGVNEAQLRAGDLSTRFAAGEPLDVHQVMIAAQEASVALNLAIQVRNKLVDGYQELMRVNV